MWAGKDQRGEAAEISVVDLIDMFEVPKRWLTRLKVKVGVGGRLRIHFTFYQWLKEKQTMENTC